MVEETLIVFLENSKIDLQFGVCLMSFKMEGVTLCGSLHEIEEVEGD